MQEGDDLSLFLGLFHFHEAALATFLSIQRGARAIPLRSYCFAGSPFPSVRPGLSPLQSHFVLDPLDPREKLVNPAITNELRYAARYLSR